MCPGPDWAQLRCSEEKSWQSIKYSTEAGARRGRGHGGGPSYEDRGDQKGVTKETSMKSWNT